MAIVRWDPWRELAGFERQFDDMFARLGRSGARNSANAWAPALDVHQDGDTMVIRAEVPGVPPEDVEITVDDNVLTISGKREEDRSVKEGQWIRRERLTGQFRRSISLPPGIDPGKVEANSDNGVIEVRVPRPSEVQPHRVSLGSGGSKRAEVDVKSGASSEKSASSGRADTDSGNGNKQSSTRKRSTVSKS